MLIKLALEVELILEGNARFALCLEGFRFPFYDSNEYESTSKCDLVPSCDCNVQIL